MNTGQTPLDPSLLAALAATATNQASSSSTTTNPNPNAAFLAQFAALQQQAAQLGPGGMNATANAGKGGGGGGGGLPEEREKTAREEEIERRDKTLAEFMLMLDDYEPLIPPEITLAHLHRSGLDTSDPRLLRLLSLAAQKFVADIATDAFNHARVRTTAVPDRRGRPPGGGGAGANAGGVGGPKDKTRTVLTMDDLSASLSERGIQLKKPEYYQ